MAKCLIEVRQPNSYDAAAVSDATALVPVGASLCQQQFADDSDINTIVRRFGLTGQLPTNVRAPMYGDFTGISDYQSALAALQAADDAFNEMPADVRARFENNPALFVDFCSDPSNRSEMEKLGLIDLSKVEKPVVAPPVVGDVNPANAA